MNYRTLFIIGFLLLAASAAAQEFRGVSMELIISNGQGREQVVVLGVREGATTGLDLTLEESELPPQPPNEIFDTRCISTPGKSQLGLGSLADFRPYPTSSSAETYTISYQAGINATGVTVSWDEVLPGRVTKLMIDGEDVAGKTSVETQFATGQIIVEVTFDATPLSFTATPNPLMFDVNNRDPLPIKTLTVTPKGESNASWTLSTDVEWLTLSPTSGEGEQDVEVSINTQVMPQGQYTGTISVRSPVYDAELDVPVQMDMVVGISDVAVPGALTLAQNYPNPFNPSTMIELDLGTLMAGTLPSLRIHDLLGREVLNLSSEVQLRSGVQSLHVDAAALPGGMYTYSLRYGQMQQTRTMLLIK
jgi:hypothetical protein